MILKKTMPKIRILHIITRMIRGGAQESTLLLVDGLKDPPYNYDVVLCSGPTFGPEGEIISEINRNRIPFFIINDLVRNPNLIKDLKALIKLYNLMKKIPFDIVHTHTSKAGVLGRIAAKLAGVPIIIHSPHGHIFHSYFSYPITSFYILLERFCSLFTDRIIALTDNDKVEHINCKIAPEDKFVVIHNGVQIEKFEKMQLNAAKKKDELQIPQNFDIVATVGRLVPEKGQQYLIDAVQKIIEKIPHVVFLVIGSGPLKNKLETKVKRLGLNNHVRFLGIRDDLAEILQTIDLFALPSLNEGMGRVLVEAMACSKPVVASCVGGIRDVVQDNITGVLVPPKDADKLAIAIVDLLKDKDRARKMGLEGKKRATDYFTVKSMVEKTHALYKELITSEKQKRRG